MDCREAREILSTTSKGMKLTSRQKQAYEHVTICQACQAGLARLTTAIKQWQQTCKDVEEILPVYVEDELAGVPVQVRYPDVSKHLNECLTCTRAHNELHNLLKLERARHLPELPVYSALHLSFLQSSSLTGPFPSWAIEMSQDAPQSHLSAMITISKAYLSNILFPQPLAWGVRSSENAGSHSTNFPVLDGLLGDTPWLVSVEILRESGMSSGAEHWHLQVTLAGPMSPGRIEVALISRGERCTAMVDEKGEVIFIDIPLVWLVNGADKPTTDRLNIQIRQIEP